MGKKEGFKTLIYMKKRKIAESLAKFYLRYGRGSSLISFLPSMIKDVVYWGLLFGFAEKWFNWHIPHQVIYYLVPGAIVAYYFLGYLDQRFGFWKFQEEYNTRHINPFFKKMEEEIRDIKESLKS